MTFLPKFRADSRVILNRFSLFFCNIAKVSFLCFIEPVKFVGEHTLLPLPFLLVQSLHILCKPQTPQGAWVICRFPRKGDRRSSCIFLDQRSCPYLFLPPCPSGVYHLTRSHQLPILQNYRVNNLPTDQTFPSPIVFLETVKFVIDHGTPAAMTFPKKQFFH